MNTRRTRTRPSWRAAESRAFRLQPALVAVAILGALLLEVWQSSAVAGLSVQMGKANHALQQANAESEWTRASLERGSNRAELSPVANAIGLKPLDPQHIVSLPEEYLEPGDARATTPGSTSLLASAGRVFQSLVPEASARGRRLN
jgi:hypothetical protein